VIDAATGTIKVTLQVNGRQKLRPGMFASVFLETATRENVPVIPKSALTLDSIGDTVFVVDGETASRRPVELGFNEGDLVEVTSGVSEGEMVIVIGQDGLSDGTPIQVLTADGTPRGRRPDGMGPGGPGRPPGDGQGAIPAGRTEGQAPATADGERKGRGGRRGGPPGGPPDLANMTDEQLEAIKERMRQRGMTDEQIEERLKRMRERAQSAGQ